MFTVLRSAPADPMFENVRYPLYSFEYPGAVKGGEPNERANGRIGLPPSGALSGGAIVGSIVAIVIVLSFIAYEVTKFVAHAGNTNHVSARQGGQSEPSTLE
jgi:hypothetical protein